MSRSKFILLSALIITPEFIFMIWYKIKKLLIRLYRNSLEPFMCLEKCSKCVISIHLMQKVRLGYCMKCR